MPLVPVVPIDKPDKDKLPEFPEHRECYLVGYNGVFKQMNNPLFYVRFPAKKVAGLAEIKDEVKIESAATPEVQKAAEADGWIPPTRYKGDAADFIEAQGAEIERYKILVLQNPSWERAEAAEAEVAALKKEVADLANELGCVRRGEWA